MQQVTNFILIYTKRVSYYNDTCILVISFVFVSSTASFLINDKLYSLIDCLGLYSSLHRSRSLARSGRKKEIFHFPVAVFISFFTLQRPSFSFLFSTDLTQRWLLLERWTQFSIVKYENKRHYMCIIYLGIIWNCKKEKWRERERERECDVGVWDLFPVVGFGDVSELLLDGVSVNVLEVEGFGGGGGESAPLGWVPTGWHAPHRVHAWGLNFLDGFLDGVEAVQQCRVRLSKGDVQQLLVVTPVLDQGKVSGFVSKKPHFARFIEGVSRPKDRSLGSNRKTLPSQDEMGLFPTPSGFNLFKSIGTRRSWEETHFIL